ncbi:MAG: polyphenol oxidase family protein [Candidatus Portiera sp.]|nr:polyphenol oxidase family protein [Portiera sp.]
MGLVNNAIQWREPTEEILQRVGSYISNNLDYPEGFGLQNPYHSINHTRIHKHTRLKHIQWLRQSHSAVVRQAPTTAYIKADACWTSRSYVACAALTADCLPVFFANASATQVAVAHAGWRGLAAGILENTLACFPKDDRIFAAFGPAISQSNYEVGKELTDVFAEYPDAFKPINNSEKHLMSLYNLAASILEKQGVASPIIPEWCSFGSRNLAGSNPDAHDIDNNATGGPLFPSHRRDKDVKSASKRNARIANLIWLK